MAEMTRRHVIRAGGALGALGAMSLVSPPAAWSWAPSGSVAGIGSGTDPRWVWDDVADPGSRRTPTPAACCPRSTRPSRRARSPRTSPQGDGDRMRETAKAA